MIQGCRSLAAWLFFILAGLASTGCAPKTVTVPDLTPDFAQTVWSGFQTKFVSDCVDRNFSLRASLNYSSAEQHSRVIISMWGATDFPIRLDIQAGVGAMLAHWREDAHGWVGFAPTAQVAYVHGDVRGGASAMGMFMPLRLNTLAMLLSGCWQTIVPREYLHATFINENIEYAFVFENNLLFLLLSPQGRPLSIRHEGVQDWVVDIDQWSDAAERYPKRLNMRQDGKSAVLRIQRADFTLPPWQDVDLSLDLPPGTRIHPVLP